MAVEKRLDAFQDMKFGLASRDKGRKLEVEKVD